MKGLPLDFGIIHIIGIGGIGMSGIAEILAVNGYRVQGSDLAENANVQRLRALGVPIAIGQRGENLGDAQVVVISSAVKPANPEVMAARARGLPVVRRAEMLAELMRLQNCVSIAGTHGKTTTTTMVAAVLESGGFDPTVINGGIINAYGTNTRKGNGEWMVVEADESDGTFVKLPSTLAVVTNIDPEHLDFYGDFEAVKAAFTQFVENVPFYGAAALCIDHPEVQALVARVTDRQIITYGLTPQADVRGVNLRFADGVASFDVEIAERGTIARRTIPNLQLPMPGSHNVQNSLAAIAIAQKMGIDDEALHRAFANFAGVKRRFTRTGNVNGVTIIDDYGHHPVEIRAVLAAARQAYQGRVIAVVQPHRYSRLRDLFEDFCTAFNNADMVAVAPVYAAGEEPIEGVNRDSLAQGLRDHGHRHVVTLDGEDHLAPLVLAQAQPGDVVVCLGAGNITVWANALPARLAELSARGAA